MNVSWIIMSHGDKLPDESVKYNMEVAGDKVDEIIWVDNATNGVSIMNELADRIIRNKENLGVARGYNPAFAIAKSEYVVITGIDTRMPEGWLKIFKEYIEKIPETGAACMINVDCKKAPERLLGERQTINGLDIVPALPLGFRVINKKIFKDCGYLREDLGLYGWDDIEFAERIVKHSSMKTYIIPDHIVEHDVFHQPDKEYYDLKRKEVTDSNKKAIMKECREKGYPIYNPY